MTASRVSSDGVQSRGMSPDPYLHHRATREARDELADWLAEQAEGQATKSRDFGRGFAEAIRVLRDAPVKCYSCDIPRRPVGETLPCPDCGSLWRIAPMGASWVPGGTPVGQA